MPLSIIRHRTRKQRYWEPHKTTAIVGASGSGKTTLMKLALNLFKPTQGVISFGNVSMEKFDIQQWRRRCGVVMQDGYIFSDTIMNNVTESAMEPIDFERYIQSLQLAHAFDFVSSFSNGHQTVIGKGGVTLSSGQRQRILIARMIYKNPDYIFLDEATNSLDSETEKNIVDNLDALFADKTRLIIAHRLNTVKKADKIVVIRNGEIAEEGTHEQLVAAGGYYFDLVKEQLQLN